MDSLTKYKQYNYKHLRTGFKVEYMQGLVSSFLDTKITAQKMEINNKLNLMSIADLRKSPCDKNDKANCTLGEEICKPCLKKDLHGDHAQKHSVLQDKKENCSLK